METNANKYLIIYHKEDNDGVFSGAIFYNYLRHTMNLSDNVIELFGADYNNMNDFAKQHSPSDLHDTYKTIILTDISFNDAKYMKKLWKEFGANLIWCDHHAPIIKESIKQNFDDIPGVRDTDRSAILCAYKFLYDQFDEAYNLKKVPELFRILSAWDSWTYYREGYDMSYVKQINSAATFTYNLNLMAVYNIINHIITHYQSFDSPAHISPNVSEQNLIKKLLNDGKTIETIKQRSMDKIIADCGDTSWKLKIYNKDDNSSPLCRGCCAIFYQGHTSSLSFSSLKQSYPELKNGIVFKRQPNGSWVISLYNIYDNDTFHCGEFMRDAYNGGGHIGAAGCVVSETQFIKILQSNTLTNHK